MGKINTTVGFTGTGGIAAALAKGLCSSGDFSGRIYVYDRNDYKTSALKDLYPDSIIIAKSNQEVIDNADVVFPTLRPQTLRQVAPSLKFRRGNRIVHLAAGIKIEEARQCFEPSCCIVRAVPLPFASRRIGPVVLYGDDPVCEKLLSILGEVVKVETEKDLEILAAITGMMVSYYGIVGETVKWATSKGIKFQSAMKYATLMNEALLVLMRNDCTEDIETFLTENTTPHGMNELGLKIMREGGVFESWTGALQQIGKHYDL